MQNCIASLDGGKHCLTYASGLAATTAVVQLLQSGDHILCGDDMYGGTNRYFSKIASRFSVKFTMTDMTNEKNIAKLILPETKVRCQVLYRSLVIYIYLVIIINREDDLILQFKI